MNDKNTTRMRWYKKKEHLLPGMLIALLAAVLILPTFAKEEKSESSGFVTTETVIESGNVTDTVTWKVTEDAEGKQTLVIGGTGPMADYSGQAVQPWLEWKDTLEKLVVEDGVTRIGNNTMYGLGFKEVQIGTGVESIGKHAFAYGMNLESIRIPGNVKVLEANAFVYHRNLRTVTLEEGVEVLEHSALGCEPKNGGDVFHIPASLKRFDDLAVWMATEYTVEEENPYFMEADGILYNKDFTALVDFPKMKNMLEYRVPDSVCEIKKGSVHRIRGVKRMYIPSTVQTVPTSYMFQWSDMEEIYIEDGVPISGDATFAGCTRLVSVRLPENIEIDKINNIFHQGCGCIESVKIPNGVVKIESFGTPTKSLSAILYDAKSAQIRDDYLFDRDIRYSLVIGESVDVLPKEFRWMTAQADSVTFQKGNQFTVAAGAFEGLGATLQTLEGAIYMDHQGVMYQLDEEKRTAKIVYCQDEFSDLYFPAVVSPEVGDDYQLTAVGKDAFKQADMVKTMYFEKPEQITAIAAYGFANCMGLESVNGLNKEPDVLALFTNAEVGYRAFYQTALRASEGEDEEEGLDKVESMPSCKDIALKGEEGASDLVLSMESDGSSLSWIQDENGNGRYQLLTGETLTILAGAGNKEAEDYHRYRIYFQKTGEDASLSILPGQSYTFDDQTVECHATEDPLCIYIEFVPTIGKTLSIPVTMVYPTPTSAGGEVVVWAVCLEKDEAEQTTGQLVLSDHGAMKAEWITIRDEFAMTQTGNGSVNLDLKGTEDGSIIPASDFSWKIELKRTQETTNSFGNDYVNHVVYRDYMILPDGVVWHDEVIDAIKNGAIKRSGSYYYAGGRRVFSLNVGGGQLNTSGIHLTWDEELETAVLQFTVRNMDRTAQMNTNTINVYYCNDALTADLNIFDGTVPQPIVNRMETTVHYQHSGKVVFSADAQKTLKLANGYVRISQTTVTKPYYFGEDVDYEITLNNPGSLPYRTNKQGTYRLQEVLSPYAYIEPEDMEKMFREEEGCNLSIEISGTELMSWTERQGVFEGTIYQEHGANSGVNLSSTATEQLVITWNEAGTGLQVIHGDTVYEKATLAESLQAAGFAPGRWTEYKLYWKLNQGEELFSLTAGKTRRFHVYARAKDTFQMLSEDWPGAYPTDTALALTTTGNVLNPNNGIDARSSVSNQVMRETYVRKQAMMEGRILKDNFTAEDGSCITYTLEMQHYGKATYENLPVVDEMYGAQALLVPVKENGHLDEAGLETFEQDEESYYILTEGTYHNVKIGGVIEGKTCIAADVLVEKVIEDQNVENGDAVHSYNGLRTTIHWDFAALPAGNYRLYLSYQSVVEQELSGKNVYSLGNVVWLNHRENSRIYGSIWGGGSIIDFEKEIVETKGTTWKEDVTDSDGYTVLSAGEQVTYRLTLQCKGDGQYSISGSDIADRLPANEGVFRWEQNKNISMTYESTHTSTQIRGLDQWTIEDSWNGKKEDNQQYILWSKDTSITFAKNGAKVYFYVTLTYPDHEEQDSLWQAYQSAVNGAMIENTFYVYQFPVNVTHHLREEGKVYLQKGVYATSYGSDGYYKEMPGRVYYNNRDTSARQVTYYMVLYNGGNKRWYLNDVYDILPQGFTVKRLLTDANLNRAGAINLSSITTATDFSEYPFMKGESNLVKPEDVRYRSANVQWKALENGSVRFRIGAGEGESAVSYDEKKQQYYLNCNEAILFGYMCDVGLTATTEERARNTILMNYTDYPKTGVVLADQGERLFEGVVNDLHMEQNDGNCSILSGEDVVNQYGILNGSLQDHWLMSDVVVQRGEIIPGVTKYTESYTSAGSGLVTQYMNAAGPYDEINWRVRLHNSGTLAMTDYTVEDILPESYVLSGTLRYEIYDCLGNLMKKYDVLTVTGRTEDTIDIININSKKTITLNGQSTYINLSGNMNGKIAMSKTENGNECISIQFSSYDVSIPEGGYMDLYLSSNNPTNQYKNKVYTNQAILTPNGQPFTTVGQGSMERAEDGTPKSVKNSSPVTITFGYATGSKLAVNEKNDLDNYAVSTNPEKNYILLSDKDSVFTYHLTVTNDTDKGMEKLVLINNLPEVGDTSPFDASVDRHSEFSVRFCNSQKEDARVKVSVKTKEGEVYELNENDYSVAYTDKTVFTEEDWNGSSVWQKSAFADGIANGAGSLTGARAIRIFIHDETGTLIPAKSEVTVVFDCMAAGDANPGEMAWNSFGYHYKLIDLSQELEAMPLCVGVKIPDEPFLKKVLEDRNGNPYLAEKAEEFHFVLYEGTAIPKEELSGKLGSKDALANLLSEKGIPYQVYSVSVLQGKSESETVSLEETDWVHGKTYTIVEVQDHSSYQLKNVNGLPKEQYSFVYEKDKEVSLYSINTRSDWTLELRKTDAKDSQPLADAEFTLYHMNENGEWKIESVRRTDGDGKIVWEGLEKEKYYIQETKAPDGYNESGEGWIVYAKDAVNGKYQLEVTNEKGLVFPYTGGVGTGLFAAAGTVVSIASCVIGDKREKRKREQNEEEHEAARR